MVLIDYLLSCLYSVPLNLYDKGFQEITSFLPRGTFCNGQLHDQSQLLVYDLPTGNEEIAISVLIGCLSSPTSFNMNIQRNLRHNASLHEHVITNDHLQRVILRLVGRTEKPVFVEVYVEGEITVGDLSELDVVGFGCDDGFGVEVTGETALDDAVELRA